MTQSKRVTAADLIAAGWVRTWYPFEGMWLWKSPYDDRGYTGRKAHAHEAAAILKRELGEKK